MAVVQRLQRGSRISSCYTVKSLPSLASLDSAFQLQEYISLLIRLDPHDVERIVAVPGKGANKDQDGSEDKDVEKDGKPEVTVDEACWIYEHLRRLAQDLSHPLITVLQQECTRATCPEMKAGEWLYLCVAHGNEGAMEQCCAIDYIIHTLDSATALLNSPRAFPSRISIPQTSHRHFSSLARRLGRIFAHAYFHHRDAFAQAEAESSLYARFLALTARFALVPAEFLVIPPRLGEDDADESGSSGDEHSDSGRPVLLVPPTLTAVEIETSGGENLPATYGQGNGATRERSPGGYMDSPRRGQRSRTDTMVLSEASAIAEELARANDEPESVDGALDVVDPVAESVIRAHEDEPSTAPTEEYADSVPSRDEALDDEQSAPSELESEPEPASTDSALEPTVAEPSLEAALHDDAPSSDVPVDTPITADVSAPTAASDRVGPGNEGPQGLIILAPPAPACETLDDGTELHIEPPPTAPEEDGHPIEPHGPETASDSVTSTAEEEPDAEGGAPVSKDAVEEPLPTGSVPVPVEGGDAPTADDLALDKLEDNIAKDSAVPAGAAEEPTSDEAVPPSGLDAAMVANEDAPESDVPVPDASVSEIPAKKEKEIPAKPKDKSDDTPSGLDDAIVDDEETKA